jgi:hypothetical protein
MHMRGNVLVVLISGNPTLSDSKADDASRTNCGLTPVVRSLS